MSQTLFLSFKRLTLKLVTLCALGFAVTGHAELLVTVEGVGSSTMPIAILPFANEKVLDQSSLTPVIQSDLASSGAFQLVNTSFVTTPPSEPAQLNYADWQSRSVQAVVIGSISVTGTDEFTVRFRLMDTIKQQQMSGYSFKLKRSQYRQVAHRIADLVYEKLTGSRGVFSSQIAYILKQGKRYELQVADSDGQDSQKLLSSPEPLMSPSWSPDGSKLAYVSFESKKPVIYVHTLSTGQRKVIANFKGNNSAPAWSPDGKKLAIVLTQDGLSQLYLMGSEGGALTRLTTSSGIDTEPTWSPDGQWIYFTSDRGGSPQIYKLPASGGAVQRVTFEGNYNVSPDISPDGKTLAFIRLDSGHYRVMLQDLESGIATELTSTQDDESPSFAPNGRMILYATQEKGRGVLAAASTDGKFRQKLALNNGEVREPAWGPLPSP